LWLKFRKIRAATRGILAAGDCKSGNEFMNFLSILQLPIIVFVFYIVPYLLALIVIVFVHEFGHFYVGRLCGVQVKAFSIGFGKEIFGFNDRHGTRWKFCWIPLGGYVRFEGDANVSSKPDQSEESSPRSLQAATVWRRMAIVAAGPAANFILTIVILTLAYAWLGTQFNEPRVDGLLDGGPAKTAGLQTGDYVRKLDGQNISSFSDIPEAMVLRDASPITLQIERNGLLSEIQVTPQIKNVPDGFGGTLHQSLLGITHESSKDPEVRHSLPTAFVIANQKTWFLCKTTLRFLGKVIMGTESSRQLHGPAGAAKVAGEAMSQGAWSFIFFIALISASIGLINLFPIPMLDGGHLVFYAIEALFGKPVSPEAQEWSYRIGLSAILMFMIFVTLNDLGGFAAMQFGT
jgi:regulator of sigma E protease